MDTQIALTAEMRSWNEAAVEQPEGSRKMVRVSAAFGYTGDADAEGAVEYLMVYREDGTADFVGLERISGTVAGHAGSFVVRHVGVYDGAAASSTFVVVPGTGTGALATLRGSGTYRSTGKQFPVAFAMELED